MTNKKKTHKAQYGELKQKAGMAYQNAVANIARGVFPDARIEVGEWVKGPDGDRDLDVVIYRQVDQIAEKIVIECKDWTRRVGIEVIDALESKRKDIGASLVMICSNSGFSENALHKAARVGIPALSALHYNDNRVRISVKEQIYTKIITITKLMIRYHHSNILADKTVLGVDSSQWLFSSKPLDAWIVKVLMNYTVMESQSKSFIAEYKFRQPLIFEVKNHKVPLNGIEFQVSFDVQWMTQIASVSANVGIYDYLRKLVIPGEGNFEMRLMDVDTLTWGKPIDTDKVPSYALKIGEQLEQCNNLPGTRMNIVMHKEMPNANPADSPDLDVYIEKESFNWVDQLPHVSEGQELIVADTFVRKNSYKTIWSCRLINRLRRTGYNFWHRCFPSDVSIPSK